MAGFLFCVMVKENKGKGMDYKSIEYIFADNIAQIRLNTPDTLNSLTLEMGNEILHALIHANENARVIIFSGNGRAFCSGANLTSSGLDIGSKARDVGLGLELVFNKISIALKNLDIPIIMQVRGAAAGIGCSYALSGDLIIASSNAYFLQAFSNIGLVPDGGSAYLLAHTVGRVKAMEMMLLGRKLSAAEALEKDMITEVVEDRVLEEVAMNYAKTLAEGPTKTFGLIRKAAWAALDLNFEDQLDLERQMQCDAGRTDDFVEGVMAFAQKRKPNFKGS